MVFAARSSRKKHEIITRASEYLEPNLHLFNNKYFVECLVKKALEGSPAQSDFIALFLANYECLVQVMGFLLSVLHGDSRYFPMIPANPLYFQRVPRGSP
jgi:hypothetical protein